jgi:hypothetical protein
VTEFADQVAAVVTRSVAGCTELIAVDRLSGGASQETYRLRVLIGGREVTLAMRRAPGGQYLGAFTGQPWP